MDPLLYGHNTDERIVAVHQKDDRTMRLYYREGVTVRHEDAGFFPFFFLADTSLLEGFAPKHWVRQLSGNGYHRYLCVFEEWRTMWDAVRVILDKFNATHHQRIDTYTQLDQIFLLPDPTAQFLMQTGRTLFKGMTLEDVHRMQLDIETYASGSNRFSNAQRPGDRIILIALSDSTGWQHVIDGREMDERRMLTELVRIITDRDPDVLEGHNIYNFDLPYILKRCEQHKLSFAVGRDGTVPRSFDTRASYAERAYEYTAHEIAGRHIIDTMLLVQSYDMTKRSMESYGLKYAARFFGFASESRTYIKGDKISWYWDNEPDTLLRYALDDVKETAQLSRHLSGTSFYLTQMLPFGYGQVARMGSAAKIESLMVREYLRLRESLPQPSTGTQTTGGYTDIFVSGVVGPVLHADVESLYPSIMINKSIAPAPDTLGVFPRLLSVLTSSRLDTKRRMKSTADPDDKAKLDAMQSSLKILINSFYGYLGYGRGLFNDFVQADVVTTTGQALLRQMIEFIRNAFGTVIEVDTDGIFFVPPPSIVTEKDEMEFIGLLTGNLPEGITVSLDGRYKKMLSYKMKNYALLSYEGNVVIKGSSLTSRSTERFGRTYIRRCIECLLNDDIDGLHRLYITVHTEIVEHKLDIRDFARTETLKDSLQDYRRDVDTGKRNRSAVYELAIAAHRNFKAGDSISYYVTGSDANVRTFESCKPAHEWNPNFPDENTAYYLRRLDEFSEKFREFFSPQDFRAIFSPDDLFPFSSDGIKTVVRTLTAQRREETETGPGIWLDE